MYPWEFPPPLETVADFLADGSCEKVQSSLRVFILAYYSSINSS